MGLEGDRPIDLVLPEADPAETLRKAVAGALDVVIIDGPPGDIDRTKLAVDVADFILAPSQPSPLDTLAMDALVELAQAAGKPWRSSSTAPSRAPCQLPGREVT
jgi:chromosome partitioning protein